MESLCLVQVSVLDYNITDTQTVLIAHAVLLYAFHTKPAGIRFIVTSSVLSKQLNNTVKTHLSISI